MVFAEQAKQGFQHCESITCFLSATSVLPSLQQPISTLLGSRDQMPWPSDQMSLIKYEKQSSAAKHPVTRLVLTLSMLWHQSKTRDGGQGSSGRAMNGVPCGVRASEQSPVPRNSRATDTCLGPRDGIPHLNYQYSLVKGSKPWICTTLSAFPIVVL